jgi:hypothetical protein
MTEVLKHEHDMYLSCKWQEKYAGLCAGFSTRRGGVSGAPFDQLNMGLHVADEPENVISNRERLAEMISFPLDNWVIGEQIHHTKIKTIEQDDLGRGTRSLTDAIKGVDGLITNKKGVLCAAFFADCVPLYFHDPVTGYIGLAHAGWKGTVNGMARKMVDQFIKKGSDPVNLEVMIGPSISGQYYEVDERVIRHISSEHVEKTTRKVAENKFLLDLKQLNVEILLQSGVLHPNIEVTKYCTFRDEKLFFSYRRDNGKTGRMLGFIGLKEDRM